MKDGKLKLDAAIALIGQAPCGLNSGPYCQIFTAGNPVRTTIPCSTAYNSSKVNFQQQPSTVTFQRKLNRQLSYCSSFLHRHTTIFGQDDAPFETGVCGGPSHG